MYLFFFFFSYIKFVIADSDHLKLTLLKISICSTKFFTVQRYQLINANKLQVECILFSIDMVNFLYNMLTCPLMCNSSLYSFLLSISFLLLVDYWSISSLYSFCLVTISEMLTFASYVQRD